MKEQLSFLCCMTKACSHCGLLLLFLLIYSAQFDCRDLSLVLCTQADSQKFNKFILISETLLELLKDCGAILLEDATQFALKPDIIPLVVVDRSQSPVKRKELNGELMKM